MVEAIEDEFVPLLVFNNRKEDEAILKSFGEPAWNNPVVRFFDATGKDLIERADGIWTTGALAKRMGDALSAAGKTVPAYLALLAASRPFDSSASEGLDRATFAMHCYWEGEARLGGLPGVLATRSVLIDGLEGVDVLFDATIISFRQLVEQARTLQCTNKVFARNAKQFAIAESLVGDKATLVPAEFDPTLAPDHDQKYYLRHSACSKLDLGELQATKLNSILANGEVPRTKLAGILSPRQLKEVDQK